jgi:hypothetical protein
MDSRVSNEAPEKLEGTKMKIKRLAEDEGEFSTNVVLQIGEKYILRHENGGERGSHSVSNKFPALLEPDEPLTAEEAAAKCLEFGADAEVISAIRLTGRGGSVRTIQEHNDADRKFFVEAFTDPTTGKPYQVPVAIQRASVRLCRSYGIRGICDPMYVANIIALELGLGDGQSNFNQEAAS